MPPQVSPVANDAHLGREQIHRTGRVRPEEARQGLAVCLAENSDPVELSERRQQFLTEGPGKHFTRMVVRERIDLFDEEHRRPEIECLPRIDKCRFWSGGFVSAGLGSAARGAAALRQGDFVEASPECRASLISGM